MDRPWQPSVLCVFVVGVLPMSDGLGQLHALVGARSMVACLLVTTAPQQPNGSQHMFLSGQSVFGVVDGRPRWGPNWKRTSPSSRARGCIVASCSSIRLPCRSRPFTHVCVTPTPSSRGSPAGLHTANGVLLQRGRRTFPAGRVRPRRAVT